MQQVDLIIIGSGPGGYKTAEYAARGGMAVVMVERDALGGTCLHSGCIPTKSLLHHATMAAKTTDPTSLFVAAQEHKARTVEQLSQGVETLMQMHGVQVVRGTAHLMDANHVEVNGVTWEARHIIIATGSQSKCLPLPEGDHSRVVNSTQLLSVPQPPQHLCIVGAGVIGMEMADLFASFGSEVTVVEYLKECLPTVDQEVAKRVRKLMERRGIRFLLSTAVTQVDGRTVMVRSVKTGKETEIEADTVLMAVGRTPFTEGLRLEEVGIEVTPEGITVNDNMQTSIPNIYAIGDVNGLCMLAHAATFQGYRAVNHIMGNEDDIRLDIIPSAVFTHPEVATVGLTEEECRQEEMGHTVHKAMYRSNGRALSMGCTDGMVKLVCNSEDVIVGCHAYGAEASSLVQEVASLMTLGVTRARLAQMVHIHPTLSELLLDACQ